MRTLPICFSLALTFVLPSIGWAQLDPEDIPPPKPVPAEPLVEPLAVPSEAASDEVPQQIENYQATPQRSLPVGANGELHAFDFGVSVVPHDAGMRVSGVFVGSPAQAAGVKPNDVIVKVNGDAVADGSVLASLVENLEISRKGVTETLTVPTRAETVRPQSIPMPTTATDDREIVPAPQRTRVYSYSVPRTTYSAPPSYRYDPRYAPRATYSVPRSAYSTRYYRYSPGYSTYYVPRSGVSIGIGYPGAGYYGRGFGYGPGYGLGPGRGRGGVGISIGGIGIRF